MASKPQFPKRRRLNPAVGHYPPSLVRSWLEVVLIPGMSKAQALRDLNEECGTAYAQNRLYDWLTGRHQPDPKARNYMLRSAIGDVLERHGALALTDSQLDRIADELS